MNGNGLTPKWWMIVAFVIHRIATTITAVTTANGSSPRILSAVAAGAGAARVRRQSTREDRGQADAEEQSHGEHFQDAF